MDEKRFTLRMSSNVYEIAYLMGKTHNRSTAKEIEFALMRYYFMLPHIDNLLRNNNFDIKSYFEPIVESEKMLVDLQAILDNYNHSQNK